MTVEQLAAAIRARDTWDDELNRQLCDLAGILDEYEKADGDTFEAVMFKAADLLGVNIC